MPDDVLRGWMVEQWRSRAAGRRLRSVSLACLLLVLRCPAVLAAGRNPVLTAPDAAANSQGSKWAEKVPAPSGLTPTQAERPQSRKLLVTVADENAVAVSSAQVTLTCGSVLLRAETSFAGSLEFTELQAGPCQIRVEKEGFYAVVQEAVSVGETDILEITLNHVREFSESVNVVYSAPIIDTATTSSTKQLGSQEIVNLPYTVTRDIRYALPLLPGIVQDAYGQLHVEGSSTRQIFDQLDGFNVTDPVNGMFNVRFSVDALRSVEVQSSRYSAEYGKGSGGVLSLRTGMGDDRFRFSATDFVPSLQNRKGFHINTWTPRATFSGPLRKGKAWFLIAPDGDYSLSIIEELPKGADRNPAWRVSNLAKAQVNLSPAHILSTSFLINRFRSEHAGLSPFNPVEATVNQSEAAYLFTTKLQSFLSNGMLLEVGFGASEFRGNSQPLGTQTYVIHPASTRGNYFAAADGRGSRFQGIANLFLPPAQWHGRHEIKLGIEVDGITTRQSIERSPFLILREDQTVSRMITFAGGRPFRKNNFEASGYAQDRWLLSDRVLVETGVRFDWDAIVRRTLVSPRLATSWMLSADRETKLTVGIGLFYDATSLDLVTRPLMGQRLDSFYDSSGENLVRPPVETSFHVDERGLKGPRFLNWSLGLERKLPGALYLRTQFLQKRGNAGWTFVDQGAEEFSGRFELESQRRDHYDALELSLRRTFKGSYLVFASYTRSSARTNAVLNFNIDNPLFAQQAGGPQPWDTPDRFLSWGWMPLPWRFTLAYSLDWRDGYPFSLVNQDQQLVGSPGSRRFPTYFSLNLHAERRLRLWGFEWALRAGFDNITNHGNYAAVNNNVDSPHFLTFGASSGRALTGRIRLLGRK